MRHPVLLSCWAIIVAMVVIALATGHSVVGGFALMISPIVAIVTLVRLRAQDTELVPRRGVTRAHQIIVGLLVALALGGVVATASRTSELAKLENLPLAVLYLASMVACYRALVRPTPRSLAVPVVVVHVMWIPCTIVNLSFAPAHWDKWQQGMNGLALLGLLFGSVLVAMIALAGFSGPRSTLPEAREV